MSTLGFEFELFLLNNEGRVVNESDRVMKETKVDFFVKEISESMVEIRGEPHLQVRGILRNFFENLEKLIEISQRMDLYFYPYGTYPGRSSPNFRSSTWYDTIKMNFGSRAIEIFPKVCGFHFHFCAPPGIISDPSGEMDFSFAVKNKKKVDILLGLYNFLVAADPAITTFMQSSPFFEGKYYGKDSRMVVWRNFSKKDGFPVDGLFLKHPQFNILPSYKDSVYSISDSARKNKESWLEMVDNYSHNLDPELIQRPSLKYGWGPVRVNPIGTLEQRGMDMNTPMHVLGVSSLLKRIMKPIFHGELKVVVADFAIKEPFKIEGDTIYIPPFEHVYDLQFDSARDGFDSPKIYEYCKAFYRSAMKLNSANKILVKEIVHMIEKNKTKSDDIIAIAGKKGVDLKTAEPSNEVWASIALNLSHKFYEQSQEALKLIGDNFEVA
ncbi:MAG: hypothetical protein ABII22_02795 [Candidatus Micrarchaeota archaeon]